MCSQVECCWDSGTYQIMSLSLNIYIWLLCHRLHREGGIKINKYKKEPVHIKPEEIFRLCTFGFSDCIYLLHSTNSRSCNVTVVECYTWEVDKILCV